MLFNLMSTVKADFSDNRGNCEALKARASRRSKMPFLAFSWWYFPPIIIKIQLNLTGFMFVIILFKIWTVSFRNEILEALKCYFSIRDEENINLVQVHQFKCTSVEVTVLSTWGLVFIWRKLKQFSYDYWCPIFALNICNGSGVMSWTYGSARPFHRRRLLKLLSQEQLPTGNVRINWTIAGILG